MKVDSFMTSARVGVPHKADIVRKEAQVMNLDIFTGEGGRFLSYVVKVTPPTAKSDLHICGIW